MGAHFEEGNKCRMCRSTPLRKTLGHLGILADFRLKAAESLVALALVDPHDSKTIMKLQNEVKKYDELFDSLRATIAAGAQLEKQLSDEQREQFIDMMVESGEGQELIDAGLLDDGGAFDS